MLDQLGELYLKFLNEPELAIDAYEAAQAFDPEDRARAGAPRGALREQRRGVPRQGGPLAGADAASATRTASESYKLLRRLYTEAKRADAAWCLCQALTVLNLAEPDEERFYRRHRADNAAPAQAALDEDDWAALAHEDVDPLVTRSSPSSSPRSSASARSRSSRWATTLATRSTRRSTRIRCRRPSTTRTACSGCRHRSSSRTRTTRPASASCTRKCPPSSSVARRSRRRCRRSLWRSSPGGTSRISVPAYYVRHLVPTGTGLKAWLFAAIKMSVPQFPVAPDLEGQVKEAMDAMSVDFQGVQREHLASWSRSSCKRGRTIDLKKWVAAIDLTADRAGFVLAHDLTLAHRGHARDRGGSEPAVEGARRRSSSCSA